MTGGGIKKISSRVTIKSDQPTPQLILIAIQAAIKTSGFAALELVTLSAISVINALGGIATLGLFSRLSEHWHLSQDRLD